MEETGVVMTIYIPRMYGIGYVFDGMFDRKIIEQCEKKIRKMEKEIKLHRQIYGRLQMQQKVCWLVNSKVAKYQNCLDTSKKIYDHIAETLSKLEVRAKQKAISKIQNHLQEKLKKANTVQQKYQTILEHESKTRASIKMLEQDLFNLIELQVNDRKPTPTVVKIHTTISVQTLVQKMSSRYQFTHPQVFNEKNGFHSKLPDVDLIRREFER